MENATRPLLEVQKSVIRASVFAEEADKYSVECRVSLQVGYKKGRTWYNQNLGFRSERLGEMIEVLQEVHEKLKAIEMPDPLKEDLVKSGEDSSPQYL